MKINIVYLLLIALSGINVSASIAQQNQNVPKTDTEVQKLKIQLQTVENEKMEIETKLAEANARLINTDIEKLKGELRESNNNWLRAWNNWFVGIVSVVAVIIGAALLLVLKTLIERAIEKRLDGFKNAVEQVNILKSQLRILQKERAISLIENSIRFSSEKSYYTQQISTLPDQALIDAFCDENIALSVKHEATTYLNNRNPVQCAAPAIDFLNLVINTDRYPGENYLARDKLRDIVKFIGQIKTREAYDELKNLLKRLSNDKSKHKDWFLTSTVFSLAHVGIELNRRDSISMIRKTLPDLDVSSYGEDDLKNLVEYFNKFQEYEGIKDILTNSFTNSMPEVEKRCMQLLRGYDDDFVREKREEKAANNTEGETDEPNQPE